MFFAAASAPPSTGTSKHRRLAISRSPARAPQSEHWARSAQAHGAEMSERPEFTSGREGYRRTRAERAPHGAEMD